MRECTSYDTTSELGASPGTAWSFSTWWESLAWGTVPSTTNSFATAAANSFTSIPPITSTLIFLTFPDVQYP
jgi:hypothetical protein